MELLKLLKSQNITQFDEVKNFLTTDPYNLIIKEDSDYPNLYMLMYNRDTGDFTNPVVRKCRGIILEKNTNQIICYTFNKGFDSDQVHNNYQSVHARKARWFTAKSFYDMFKEADNIDYSKLDPKRCYSFVLKHPENRIVVKYDQPSLIHVLTRNLETLEEELTDIGIEKPRTFDFNSYQEILAATLNRENNTSEGYMLVDENWNRVKVMNQSYLSMKELKGNTNNLFYRFLQLRENNLVDEYLEFYPEIRTKFGLYKMDLYRLAKTIHREYLAKHVTKTAPYLSGHFRPIVYRLHGVYLTTHEQTTVQMVMDEIDKLHPNQICFMYNRTFTPHHPFRN